MNAVQFQIEWKNYLRNRLLGLIKRIGPDIFVKQLKLAGKKYHSIMAIVCGMDDAQCRLYNSIERYGLARSDGEQVFHLELVPRISNDVSANRFLELLHENYTLRLAFLENLSEDDLETVMESPLFTSNINIGWIIQYASLMEQDVTGRIELLLEQNKIKANVPWSTNRFMKPVTSLALK